MLELAVSVSEVPEHTANGVVEVLAGLTATVNACALFTVDVAIAGVPPQDVAATTV